MPPNVPRIGVLQLLTRGWSRPPGGRSHRIWHARRNDEMLIGLVLRHVPSGETNEIAGHLHPKARLSARRRHLSCRCFAADGDRLLLPALGSFTGGLNVRDPAIARLFPEGFQAYLLGERRVHRFPHHALSPEPDALSHRRRA